AAQKYIDLNRIATGVSRIQKENAALRQQQLLLAVERDNLPVATQGSVLGLIGSVATALTIEAKTAQLALVVFLSVLLDLFAAFFVGLIGEELRFSRTLKLKKMSKTEGEETPSSSPLVSTSFQTADDTKSKINPNDELLKKAITLLNNGVRCSKKALSTELSLNNDDTDKLFSSLLTQGLVIQKANRHFVWIGDEETLQKAA
ncbi:MAG: Preprotein translocase subunit SecY, partial [Psychromonas sp.]|nr:Preprotein translocase subunit SecY [Psychromonas sp.]